MKKILITVPTLMAGGMERAAVNFAKILTQKGIEVKIFTISNNHIFYELPDNIEVINGKKNLNEKWKTLISLYKLRKLAIAFNPEYILSFSGKMSANVILSLLGLKCHVIPFHRSNPYLTYGVVNNILNKILFPYCHSLVVQTNIGKKVFQEKYGNNNIIVAPNPVRDLFIDESVEKENIILTVSRLVNGKGLQNLIKIFKKANKKDWNLYILGDGYLRKDLEKLINELGLNDNVKLLGFQKDVDYYLSRASIFAFSSESEGFPNSLLEAMCAGLACISYDCPTGPAEMIIDGKNGYLVPLHNEVQYLVKLNKLLQDNTLRISFGCEAKKLIKVHSSEKIVDLLIAGLSTF